VMLGDHFSEITNKEYRELGEIIDSSDSEKLKEAGKHFYKGGGINYLQYHKLKDMAKREKKEDMDPDKAVFARSVGAV